MLVDIKRSSNEEIKKQYENQKTESWFPKDLSYEDFQFICGVHPENRLETGIYWFFNSNLPIGIYPTEKEYYLEEFWYENFVNSYGVADNIEQIKDYYKDQINDPNRKYFIVTSRIYQDDQPNEGGWRWHKWGPYIGNLDHQCEYLKNENFNESWQGYVIIFSCIELKEKEKA